MNSDFIYLFIYLFIMEAQITFNGSSVLYGLCDKASEPSFAGIRVQCICWGYFTKKPSEIYLAWWGAWSQS